MVISKKIIAIPRDNLGHQPQDWYAKIIYPMDLDKPYLTVGNKAILFFDYDETLTINAIPRTKDILDVLELKKELYAMVDYLTEDYIVVKGVKSNISQLLDQVLPSDRLSNPLFQRFAFAVDHMVALPAPYVDEILTLANQLFDSRVYLWTFADSVVKEKTGLVDPKHFSQVLLGPSRTAILNRADEVRKDFRDIVVDRENIHGVWLIENEVEIAQRDQLILMENDLLAAFIDAYFRAFVSSSDQYPEAYSYLVREVETGPYPDSFKQAVWRRLYDPEAHLFE